MHVVTVGKESIGHLPLETQHELLWQDLERLDRELPVRAVIDDRTESMAATASPYNSTYDIIMRNVLGNPYETLAPRIRSEHPTAGEVVHGFRLFSGLSEDGEILHVSGEINSRRMREPAGYAVHRLDLPSRTHTEWHVRDVAADPRGTSYNVELLITKQALMNAAGAHLLFRTTCLSDARITQEGQATQYSRGRLKNLFSVVHAFDARYRHLEVLYRQTPTVVAAAFDARYQHFQDVPVVAAAA